MTDPKELEHAYRAMTFAGALRNLYASLDFYPELRTKLFKAIVEVVKEEAGLLNAELTRDLGDPPPTTPDQTKPPQENS